MLDIKQICEFIKKNPKRTMTLWLSCFDKARTTEEIANIWGYSSFKAIQLGRINFKLIEYKLLRVEKIERKKIFYKSVFDVYPEIIDYIINNFYDEITNVNKEFYKDFLKDKDIFLKIIDSEEYRKTFLDVFLIKKTFKENRDIITDYNISLFLPIFPLLILVTMKALENINKDIEFEKLKNSVMEIYNFLWKLFLTFGDINEYFKSVKDKLDKETFDKLTKDLERTDLYKKYKIQAEIFKQFSASIIKQQ